MAPTESKLFVMLAFILTLAAGLAGGLLGSRLMKPAPPVTAVSRSVLDELQLSADQSQQMRRIWESVRDSAQGCLLQGQALRQQRDKAMESLLTDEQKARFQKVDQEYNAQVVALNNKREIAFQKGVEQTQQILSVPQRKAYERILRAKTGRDPGQKLLDPSTDAPVTGGVTSAASVSSTIISRP